MASGFLSSMNQLREFLVSQKLLLDLFQLPIEMVSYTLNNFLAQEQRRRLESGEPTGTYKVHIIKQLSDTSGIQRVPNYLASFSLEDIQMFLQQHYNTTTVVVTRQEEILTVAEAIVKAVYMDYLASEYPTFTFTFVGFGSNINITRPIKTANAFNLNAPEFMEDYYLHSSFLYFWYEPIAPSDYYDVYNDTSEQSNISTCGRCSRKIQCCW